MRRGEVFALRWKNVDLDRGSLRVMESLEQTKAGIRFKAPKTDKTRAITLPAFAVDELRRLKRQQAEELLMARNPAERRRARVRSCRWTSITAPKLDASFHAPCLPNKGTPSRALP